jgi:bifunctional DNA-binding transcriptional regulator/antitoxin component of YhaV-PrlF toxin-antitoxin module
MLAINMVRFKSKVDRNGRIYLPKPIREAGLTNILEIQPNTSTIVVYSAETSLKDVLMSIRIIAADVEHQLSQQNTSEEREKALEDILR